MKPFEGRVLCGTVSCFGSDLVDKVWALVFSVLSLVSAALVF